MEKVRLIRGSLRCLTLGWLALIPGIGIAFAVSAMGAFAATLRNAEEEWNPAKWHLFSGAALALVSFLAHGVLVVGLLSYLLR